MATQYGKAAGKQSVTGHPMFPALVALWFGALLGLGSLAVRPALLEQLVLDLGIDSMIAAAAPPLGTTFRMLLALSMAAVGAVIGAVIALRMRGAALPADAAVAAPRRARDAHPDAPPRAPISAREEFGDDDLDNARDAAEQPLPGRRRPLAIAEDARADDFHDFAPLPGGAPAAYGFDATARLDALVEKLGGDTDRSAPPLDNEPDEEEQLIDEPLGAAFAPPTDGPRESNEDLPFGRPHELFAPPFAAMTPESETVAPCASAEALDAAPAIEPQAAGNAEPAPASAAERLVGRPLEQMSTAELTERLAIALHRRSQRADAARKVTPVQMQQPDRIAEIPRDQAGSAPAIPSPLLPIDLAPPADAGEDDDWATLPLRRIPSIASDAVAAEDDELDEETLADGYSSLLDLSRPPALRNDNLGHADADSDSEAMVTFPGQEARRGAMGAPHVQPVETAFGADQPLRRFDARPAGGVPIPAAPGSIPALDREEADRALRAALATLQRMSGAA